MARMSKAARARSDEALDREGTSPKYRFTFDRISRDHNVAPLEARLHSDDEGRRMGGHPSPEHLADRMAEVVFRYAFPRMVSRDVEVVVDLNAMAGTIYAGFHTAGQFTIEELA